MIARLREIAGRPLEPGVGRGLVILAGAVCVGFAVLLGLGLFTPGAPRPTRRPSPRPPVARPAPTARPSAGGSPAPAPAFRTDRPAQDPQDRPGTPAARRASRQLATHRALQHVPWRRGGVSIRLVGAEGGRAILAVSGPTVAARRGYRSFLRIFGDDGASYRPRLRTRGARRG